MTKKTIQKSVFKTEFTELLIKFKEKIGLMLYDYTIFTKETNTKLSFDEYKCLLSYYQKAIEYKGYDLRIGKEEIKIEESGCYIDEDTLSKPELKLLSFIPDIVKDFETIDKYYYDLLGIIIEKSKIKFVFNPETKDYDFNLNNKDYAIIGYLDSGVKLNKIMNTLTVLDEIIR